MPTNYAGEAYRIQTKSEVDFDGNPLDPNVVTSVHVQVFNSDFTTVITEGDMDYDTDISHWTFLWDTETVEPGTYKAMVEFFFPDGTSSLEGPKRIRLKRDPR